MSRKIYVCDTSNDLQDLRPIIIDLIRAGGMTPLWLDETERQSPDMLTLARTKIQEADGFIGLITYRHGWQPAGMDGQSLAEIEYNLARELGKPVVMLMPKGASKLGLHLRQRAFNQSIEQHKSQNAFWKRIAEDGTALIFEDATDLSRQLAQLFNQWAANLPAALAAAAEAILPPPPPAPPVPGSSGAPPREAPVPRGLPMLDVETLSDQIAEKTAAKLLTYQQNQQQNLAEQAVKVNEALRLWPGELVFGRPAKSQQFQSDVFVVMPFAAAFAPVYTDIIKPLAAELKLTILRGDELSSSRGSIMEEVWAALNACRFVIAEITGGNDNVFYELGIAHTLNKPAILITQAAAPEAVPFDIRHLRYVRYENTPEGGVRLRSDLQTVITRLLAELDAVDSA